VFRRLNDGAENALPFDGVLPVVSERQPTAVDPARLAYQRNGALSASHPLVRVKVKLQPKRSSLGLVFTRPCESYASTKLDLRDLADARS